MKQKLLAIYLLENFTSSQTRITISNNIIIKKGKKQNREEFFGRIKSINNETSNYHPRTKNEFFLYFYYEETGISSNEMDNIFDSAYHKVDKLLQLFRSFQGGKIKINYYQRYFRSKDTNKYVSIGFISLPKNDFTNYNSTYDIPKKLTNVFRRYANNFEKINFDKNKALDIALKRFSFSYEKVEWEDKLIDLMICYEALFLGGNEKSELNYKLALRVSRFIKSNNKKELFSFIKKSYDLRSKVVHGASITKEIDKKVPFEEYNYIFGLREILRSCFYEILIKYYSESIESIIKTIDEKVIEG